jgi:hypothetical protein
MAVGQGGTANKYGGSGSPIERGWPTSHSRHKALAVGALLLLGPACSDAPAHSPVGEETAPIRHGQAPDDPTSGVAGSVVYLDVGFRDSETWLAGCSGVVVSPRHVLTSAACFVEGRGGANFRITNAATLESGDVGTIETVGDVSRVLYRVVSADTFDSLSNAAVLIQLTESLDLDGIVPAALPEERCPPEFDGTHWGYGEKDYYHYDRQDLNTNEKRFGAWHIGQTHEDGSRSVFLESVIDGPGLQSAEVDQQADTGGPLFGPSGELCGILLTTVTEGGGGTFGELLGPLFDQHRMFFVDVSRAGTRRWIEDQIYDKDGGLKGSCDSGPEDLREEDSDGDWIPDSCDLCPFERDDDYDISGRDRDTDGVRDSCDNCPSIWNPIERSEFYDPRNRAYVWQPNHDFDSHGDACDWADTQPIEDQGAANCNMEAELTLHYPGESQPPRLFTSAEGLDTYDEAFQIGSNEAAPCPRIALAEKGSLPGRADSVTSRLPLGRTAELRCTSTPRNVIVQRPMPSTATTGLVGRVGANWCPCNREENGDERDTGTRKGRAQCQDVDCTGLAENFGDAPWLEIVTTPTSNRDWSDPPLSPTRLDLLFTDPTINERFLWDYTLLPGFAELDPPLSELFGPSSIQVQGVLWNSVLSFDDIADPDLHEQIVQRGQFLQNGTTGYQRTCTITDVDFFPVVEEVPIPCWHCPDNNNLGWYVDPSEDPFPLDGLTPEQYGDLRRGLINGVEHVTIADAYSDLLFDARLGDSWVRLTPAERPTLLQSRFEELDLRQLLSVTVDTEVGEVPWLISGRDNEVSVELADGTPFFVPVPAGETLNTTAAVAFSDLRVNDGVALVSYVPEDGTALANLGPGVTNVGVEAAFDRLYAESDVELRNRAAVPLVQTRGLATVAVDALVEVADSYINLSPAEVAAKFRMRLPDDYGAALSLAGSTELAPETYGEVTVQSGATVTLRSGNYLFEGLLVEPNGQLVVDDSDGPVAVFARDRLIYRGRIVPASGGDFVHLLFAYTGTAEAFIEAPFIGAVLAPNAKVSFISTASGHTGSFFAKSLEFHQNTNIRHRPFDWDGIQSNVPDLPFAVRPNVVPSSSETGTSSPGAIADREGLVLSASRLQLFSLGSGQPGTSSSTVWVYSLDEGTWASVALSDGIADVVAATYDFHDDQLHFIERSGSQVTLKSWTPGATEAELIQAVPYVSEGFSRHWLSASAEGQLVHTATADGGTLMARFARPLEGAPYSFQGSEAFPVRVLATPLLTSERVVTVSHSPGEEPSQGGINVVEITPGNVVSEVPDFDFGGSEECEPQIYEAESMFQSTGGPATGGWNIWTNGYVSQQHAFEAGSSIVSVVAKGQAALGVWPRMLVSVGGVTIGDVFVTSSNYVSYEFPYQAVGGSAEVRVSFVNDYYVPPDDRNLFVDKVTVSCGDGPSGPTCSDAQQNGSESDVDCGGVDCAGCPVGMSCVLDADCASENCMLDACAGTSSAARYRFESGVAGWSFLGAPATGTSTSVAQAYDGSNALAVAINGSGNPRVWVGPSSPPVPGQLVTFRVFIPSNAPVTAAQPYVSDKNWQWSSSWYNISAGMKGSWQTFTVSLAGSAALPAREVGIKFYQNGSYNGPIYVDAVTW